MSNKTIYYIDIILTLCIFISGLLIQSLWLTIGFLILDVIICGFYKGIK